MSSQQGAFREAVSWAWNHGTHDRLWTPVLSFLSVVSGMLAGGSSPSWQLKIGVGFLWAIGAYGTLLLILFVVGLVRVPYAQLSRLRADIAVERVEAKALVEQLKRRVEALESQRQDEQDLSCSAVALARQRLASLALEATSTANTLVRADPKYVRSVLTLEDRKWRAVIEETLAPEVADEYGRVVERVSNAPDAAGVLFGTLREWFQVQAAQVSRNRLRTEFYEKYRSSDG